MAKDIRKGKPRAQLFFEPMIGGKSRLVDSMRVEGGGEGSDRSEDGSFFGVYRPLEGPPETGHFSAPRPKD